MITYLQPGRDAPGPSAARTAIVTLVMGEAYETTFARVCRDSWIAYAERIGADIIVLTDRIDPADTARSPAWQKLLILDLPWAQRYERVIWLDSDIIVSSLAPDIVEFGGPPEKVGLCKDSGRLSQVEAQIYLESVLNLRLSPHNVETSWGVAQRERYIHNQAPPHDVLFNTGVMVLSPAHHNAVLKSAYGCPEVTHLYEQPHLSHRLIEQDLAHVLSPRFNWGVIEPIQLCIRNGLSGDESETFVSQMIHIVVRAQLRNAYFLHFNAAMQLLRNYAISPAFDPPAAAA